MLEDYPAQVLNRVCIQGYNGFCPRCKSSRRVADITLPYAAKLLVQELMAMVSAPSLTRWTGGLD